VFTGFNALNTDELTARSTDEGFDFFFWAYHTKNSKRVKLFSPQTFDAVI
jgi:hypothetical protein